ncbi:hypothetical protein IEQ34_003106 [Dendrobium chrysotoxum]|uniref:Uncharacterized protein n=1 Tax=Dendrobium chrysotoxum TaxID=161865 RepID=A0AAV7HJ28_DENCH|nr:hypothetical protein IEQ34_003106 [Dendrobium chrysotoxum]
MMTASKPCIQISSERCRFADGKLDQNCNISSAFSRSTFSSPIPSFADERGRHRQSDWIKGNFSNRNTSS